MARIPLAPGGRREMILLTVLLGAVATAGAWMAVGGHTWGVATLGLTLPTWLGGLAFFRDPDRSTPREPDVLVAPADGKVADVAQLAHHDDVGGPATRIGIFLSVFDVHVNRSPCCGTVRAMHYRPGRYLDARDPEAGRLNEANTIVIEPDERGAGPVVVRQIAGLVARRIVCEVRVGDRVETGQRIGLIKFGSRTELIVPQERRYQPAVQVGEHVRGATSVLARREDSAAGETLRTAAEA